MINKNFFLIMSLWTLLFFQESYYVTFVKGRISLKKNGKLLKIGDAIAPTDVLLFSDAGNQLSCISPGKGRFNIQLKPAKGSSSELLAILKNALVPATAAYRFSTRVPGFKGYDPKSYFRSTETNGQILLIKDQPLPIADSFKIDEQHFFFIQYEDAGKRQTKKLVQNQDGLIFGSELSGFKGREIMLCYQSIANGTANSVIVAEFIPVFITEAELNTIIKVWIDHSGNQTKAGLRKDIVTDLYEHYGKIGPELIDQVLKKI